MRYKVTKTSTLPNSPLGIIYYYVAAKKHWWNIVWKRTAELDDRGDAWRCTFPTREEAEDYIREIIENDICIILIPWWKKIPE